MAQNFRNAEGQNFRNLHLSMPEPIEAEPKENDFDVDAVLAKMDAPEPIPVAPAPAINVHAECVSKTVHESELSQRDATITQLTAKINELETLLESTRDIAEHDIKEKLHIANSCWNFNDQNIKMISDMERQDDRIRVKLGRKPLYEKIITAEQQKNLDDQKRSRDEWKRSMYASQRAYIKENTFP